MPSIIQKTWVHPKFTPPLQGLLIWQSISLFWICGLFSARYLWAGLCASLLIFILDKRLHKLPRAIASIIIFTIGFCTIHLQVHPLPSYPSWAIKGKLPAFSRIEGTVSKVESLPDQRLRIYLRNVHSLEHKNSAPLAGLMLWTWEAVQSQKNTTQPELAKLKQAHSLKRPQPGQIVQINARIRSTESFRNFNSSDFGFYWQSQEVYWRIWSRGDYGNPLIIGEASIFANVRHKAMQSIEQILFTPQVLAENIKTQARAFIPALLFGEKYYLNQSTMENMQAASLIHSLALSGQHLSLVGLCALMIICCIYKLFPKILLIFPRRHWLGLCSLPLALVYLWLGNAPPSLIRASLMLLLALIFYWRARPANLCDILLMTLLLITCYNPAAIFHLGLQLSVLCVASIVLINPLLKRVPKPNFLLKQHSPIKFICLNGLRGILQIFIISLGIQVALLPLFLYYFAPSGPWFMLNIIWLPILSLWVLPLAALGLIFASLLPQVYISAQILYLAAIPCEYLLNILQLMRIHNLFDFPILLRPHWTTQLAWVLLCIFLASLIGRIKQNNFHLAQIKDQRFCISLIIILFFTGPFLRYIDNLRQDIRIEMLDVGQGQAICIRLSGGERILVDGGGTMSTRFDIGKAVVVPRLVYNAAPRLLAVISTHPDTDHLNGLISVLEKMHVGTFYHNGASMPKIQAEQIKLVMQNHKMPPQIMLKSPMRIDLPSINNTLSLEVLNPTKIKNVSSNNKSIVLRLVHEQNAIKQGVVLLGADAEKPALTRILKQKQNINADIFIIPHHGSKDALLKNFYDAVHAKIALISSGIMNSFGFPHQAILNELASRNITTYNTATHGGVQINWQSNAALYKVNGNTAQASIKVKITPHSKLALHQILR